MNWNPPADVVTHAGTQLDPDMEFIIEPPPAIGNVVTAWSTVGRGKGVMSVPTRIVISAAVALAIAVGLSAIAYFTFDDTDEMPQIALGSLVLGLVVGIIAFFTTASRHNVSFVGELGAARYFFKHLETGPTREEVLVFADASDLTTKQVNNFTNGVYTGTTYDFCWTGPGGNRLLRLHGSYHDKNGNPKPKDAYHFAASAEAAYCAVALERSAAELERNGSIEFRVDRNNSVRVGVGFLEFNFKGTSQRVVTEDIRSLRIDSGMFYIDTNDATFFSRRGKFRFEYGSMSNARVFLFALEQLAGFHFE